jgi:two-component system response regulator FixJ
MMMAGERTVHVVDDDAGVRRSLERLLDAAGFRAVSYQSALAFLDAAPGLAPGCVLLDVRMPGMDGLTLQSRLAKLDNHLPVVIMTGQGDVQTAVRAMKAGAVDFIEKPYDDEILVRAIELALSLPRPSDRNEEATKAAQRVAALSRRERQVLDGLVSGLPNKVIAYELGISVRTVEVHRARMMERLGVRQLAEAIRLGVMARLAPADAASINQGVERLSRARERRQASSCRR